MFLIVKIEVHVLKLMKLEMDFMNSWLNFFFKIDIVGFQEQMKYINILTLCQLIITGSVEQCRAQVWYGWFLSDIDEDPDHQHWMYMLGMSCPKKISYLVHDWKIY